MRVSLAQSTRVTRIRMIWSNIVTPTLQVIVQRPNDKGGNSAFVVLRSLAIVPLVLLMKKATGSEAFSNEKSTALVHVKSNLFQQLAAFCATPCNQHCLLVINILQNKPFR